MIMLCYIYKSLKKADTYVFLGEKDRFAQIPKSLQDLLGKLDFVMKLDLAERDKLAYADPKQVIQKIKDDGFYLQLPPKDQY